MMSDQSRRHPLGAQASVARAPNANRRRFLMFGATAATAAASAPVLAAPAALVEDATPESESKGYQETSHVRRYYATTRL
jgi:hypothetical protein